VLALVQRVAPRVSHWGPPLPPPVTSQWGPYGVWVSYTLVAPVQHQLSWGEPAGHDSWPSVINRLGNAQSSSSNANQGRLITYKTLSPQEVGRATVQHISA